MDMLPPADLSARDAQALFERIAANIEKVMRGQHARCGSCSPPSPPAATCCWRISPAPARPRSPRPRGLDRRALHARASSRPDLLPSDILGVSVFNQRDQVFEFRDGPVFTNILLADEINRASPARSRRCSR